MKKISKNESKQNVINKIVINSFKIYLFENKEKYQEKRIKWKTNCISSYRHELYSIEMNILALSSKDKKTLIKENKRETSPGAKRIIYKL